MKRLPIALGLIVFGLMIVILGAANGWAAGFAIGGIAVVGGWIWFAVLWDKLVTFLVPFSRYDRHVKRVDEQQKNHAAYQQIRDRSIDRQLKEIQKQNSQKIKGQVVYVNRKDA